MGGHAAFVAAARTAAYRVDARWTHPPLDDVDGSPSKDSYSGTVSVVFPGQSQSRLDAGPFLRDRVFDGDTAYGREGDTEVLLDAEPWRAIDLRTDEISGHRTFLDRPGFVSEGSSPTPPRPASSPATGPSEVRVSVAARRPCGSYPTGPSTTPRPS